MMKLLVVDDDQDYQDYIGVILQDLGFESVTHAYSSQGALDKVKENHYDAILTDLVMPEVDGVQLLRMLSENNFLGKVLIISSTGTKLMQSIYRLARIYNLNIVGSLDKADLHNGKIKEYLDKTASFERNHSQFTRAQFKEWELRQAIANDELCLHYQPKVCSKTLTIQGVEALVRWNNPELGLIQPKDFISRIERFQLSEQLCQWVIQQALHDLSIFDSQIPNLSVSINLSVLALYQLNLTARTLQACEKYAIQPNRVTFEITESQVLEKASAPLETLTRLSLNGFKLSIDDFGTGYSSLEQLNRLPFDELKVDQCFVQESYESEDARIIIENCVQLAKNLQLNVVAEGVETKEMLSLVQDLGCDQIQGHFIAKPMDRLSMLQWVSEYRGCA